MASQINQSVIKARLVYGSKNSALIIWDTDFSGSQIVTPDQMRKIAKELISIADEADLCQHLDYQEYIRSY